MSNRSWVRLAIGSGSGRRDEVHQGQPRLRASRTLLGLGLGAAMAWGLAGCHQTPPATLNTTVDQNGADPADANMASVGGSAQPAQVLGQNAQYQPQQQGEDYSQQQAAPIERVAPNSGDQSYSDYSQPSDQAADPYATDLTDEQASQPPPPLPDYDQPPDPDPDYLWTPGYWAWSPGATTGSPARGSRRRMWARSGPLATGDLWAATIAGTMVSGDRTSASMAASTTALGTPATDTMAATGMAATSSTTRPSIA